MAIQACLSNKFVYPDFDGEIYSLTNLKEIETWVDALAKYDSNEFEESLKVFDQISDTSKILFNCGVIHATLGEHAKAVCISNQREIETSDSSID